MAVPSAKQTRCVWSFCVKYGSGGHDNRHWTQLGQKGRITKRSISPIIGNIKNFQKEPTPELKAKIELQIGEFFPGFQITSNPFPDGPEKVEPGAPEKKKKEQEKKAKAPEDTPSDDGDSDKVKKMLEALEQEMEAKMPKSDPRPELPEFEVREGYIKPDEFDEACVIAQAGENVLFTGPAGLGKSRMAEEMAYALGVNSSFIISFGGSMRFGQIFGTTQIETDEHGNQISRWVPSQLMQALQEPGVVVLDEVFSADSDINNGLNSILEPGNRSWMSPNGIIKVHDDCHVVGTANTSGRSLSNQYTGANVADGALVDRFTEMKLDYNLTVEDTMLMDVEDVEVETYFKSNLKKLRDAIKANNIFFDASTRRLLRCIKLFKAGISAERAFELSFLQSLSLAEKTKCGF